MAIRVAKCLAILRGPNVYRVYDVNDDVRLRSEAEEAIQRVRAEATRNGYKLVGDTDPAQYGLATAVAFCLAKERDDVVNRYLLGLWLLRHDEFFTIKGSFAAEWVAADYKKVPNIEAFEVLVEHLRLVKPAPEQIDGAHRRRFI